MSELSVEFSIIIRIRNVCPLMGRYRAITIQNYLGKERLIVGYTANFERAQTKIITKCFYQIKHGVFFLDDDVLMDRLEENQVSDDDTDSE